MPIRVTLPRTANPRSWTAAFVRASLFCLSLSFVCALPAAFGQATPTPQKPTNQAEPKPNSYLRPEANRLPDANDIMLMREQKTTKAKFEAANTERKRQLDEDTLALVRLAAEVNGDLETTGRKPSPEVLRKIEDIERLAHNVQVKMKLTMSAAN